MNDKPLTKSEWFICLILAAVFVFGFYMALSRAWDAPEPVALSPITSHAVVIEDGVIRDIPILSDYDRGFNDALDSYMMLHLSVDLAQDGATTITGSNGVTNMEWWRMPFGERFDVLREMYGVEKSE